MPRVPGTSTASSITRGTRYHAEHRKQILITPNAPQATAQGSGLLSYHASYVRNAFVV